MTQCVLVVDDYPDALAMLQAVLTKAGYDVITASDGVEAVDAARRHHPDLVVMDICMPRMDGVTATQQIRTIPGMDAVPVVAYTAKPKALADQPGLFDDVCAKPCAPQDLLARVARLANRG